MTPLLRLGALAVLAGVLAACSGKPREASIDTGGEPALKVMERVALAARDCWFRGRDTAFSGYSMAPELDSHSGRPRILVVPRSNPGGLPLLVVEGQGKPARIQTFGPLLNGPSGPRIAADVARWQGGDRTCANA
ncbi:hypothetical protein NDN16_16115 [Aureimonas altamirensis]|uniref:hypothetical protein n=1 Tax=Aureimonas altamirensis TaxID=370622 RepID=UPI002037670D|nr:hypothetical protein [Aureimonas altamirensis]